MRDIPEDEFCYYPFMQMLLQPTGIISPCCWNQEYVYGQIPEQTLIEIWNSESAQQLRKEFLEGKPTSCAKQMRHIGCHKFSRRLFNSELELSEIQKTGPKRFDVRLNGRCNLQCVMCEVWKQPNGLYDQSDFWKKGPTEIFPFLKEMDVLGGEPFVQADTYRLIDEIAAVNPLCSWAFVTNGSYKFTDTIRSRLDKIPIRWMQVSVDSLDPKTYSEVRVKGDLTRTLSTIEQLLRYRRKREFEGRGFRILASICVQKLNWKEVHRFLDYFLERRIEPILQFLYDPFELSLLSLSAAEKEEVCAFFMSNADERFHEFLNPIVMPIEESLHHE